MIHIKDENIIINYLILFTYISFYIITTPYKLEIISDREISGFMAV